MDVIGVIRDYPVAVSFLFEVPVGAADFQVAGVIYMVRVSKPIIDYYYTKSTGDYA